MRIFLTTYNELYIVDSEQLLYLEADDHYTMVNYTSGTRFMVPFGLSKVEVAISEAFAAASSGENAPERTLIRVGRKFLINTKHVIHINTMKQVLVLANAHGENFSLRLPKAVLRSLIDLLTGNNNIYPPRDGFSSLSFCLLFAFFFPCWGGRRG